MKTVLKNLFSAEFKAPNKMNSRRKIYTTRIPGRYPETSIVQAIVEEVR